MTSSRSVAVLIGGFLARGRSSARGHRTREPRDRPSPRAPAPRSLCSASQARSGGIDVEASSQSSSPESASTRHSPVCSSSSNASPSSLRTCSSFAHSRASTSSTNVRPARACVSDQWSAGHAVSASRPPGRQTRASSAAARSWSGAKIAPKAEATASNSASAYGSSWQSPSSKRIARPSASAARRALASWSAEMSMPVTSAPARAARSATPPVPQATSRKRVPGSTASASTTRSWIGAKVSAMRS